MFDTPEAKQAVLDNLIAERALDAEIARSHLTVNDATLAKAIAGIDAFSKPDGNFDMEQYKAAAGRAGHDRRRCFDARMRRDLAHAAADQLDRRRTAFAPRTRRQRACPTSTTRNAKCRNCCSRSPIRCRRSRSPTTMVKAFYDKNADAVPDPGAGQGRIRRARRRQPSKARSPSPTPKSPTSTTRTRSASRRAEQRTASHILINARQGRAEPAEKAAAKAKAEAMLAEVRKNPADFAGSPRRSRRIRARPNWAATWAWSRRAPSSSRSKTRSTSSSRARSAAWCESEFGFHIITVTARQAGRAVKPLDEVEGRDRRRTEEAEDVEEVFGTGRSSSTTPCTSRPTA